MRNVGGCCALFLRSLVSKMGHQHMKLIFFIGLIVMLATCDEQDSTQLRGERDSLAIPRQQHGHKRIPHVYISTTGGAAITSNDDYVRGAIEIDGTTASDDFNGSMRIRWRGNTSMFSPKKSFKINLDTKSVLFGLAEEKDWVLLANWIDGSLLCNAVAMKAGELLGVAYVNHIIPVDLSINGQYQGSYVFTEQVEAGKNRVNVGATGQLLELDLYFDEPWKFRTSSFNLPVMIKHPEIATQAQLDSLKTDFELLTNKVASTSFPENDYLDYIDEESLIKYFIVMMLTDNEEINHPKSIYMHKSAGGKYTMGPLWDFDWAFGYEGNYEHFQQFDRPLFWSPFERRSGTSFFHKFLRNPQTREKTEVAWKDFKENKLPLLINFVESYSATIEDSYAKDYELWGGDPDQLYRHSNIQPEIMIDWLKNRADFMDSYINDF
jgi:hypothetical protein